MHKIAVVGDKTSVLAFQAMGIDVYIPGDGAEARKMVDSLAMNGYGVIFITEPIAAWIPDTLARYDNKIVPAVIPIPSNQGTQRIGMERINQYVEKAVGANIL
jgi:ATP synthase (F/14-kDa) subunit.